MNEHEHNTSNDLDTANDIEELQMKIAFQDDLIEKLNEALIEQQNQIHTLQHQMQHVIKKVKGMSASDLASEEEEAPPPHY